MKPALHVIGFVPIYGEGGQYRHLLGTTFRMQWPGPAESLLERLTETGYCLSWRPADPDEGEPAEYRGARVFRCRRATPGPEEAASGSQLIAIWEGHW